MINPPLCMGSSLLSVYPLGSPPASNFTTLKGWATQVNNFQIGTAVRASPITSDITYQTILAQEYNSLTPENDFKFTQTEPSQNSFVFVNGDAIVSFATAHNMAVHGHNLVWVDNLPAWVTGGGFSKASLLSVMQNHINNVVGHFSPAVASWDVVNEPLDSLGTYRGGAGTWFAVIGSEYVDDAFIYARAAAPNAKLYLNDDGIFLNNTKARSYLTLIASMISRGIPIDGVGFQCHFHLDAPSADVMQQSLEQFGNLGLEVRVTELDVSMVNAPSAANTADQASVFSSVMDACIRTSACRALTTWGFTDKYQTASTTTLALPFDSSYSRKSAYTALYTRLSVPRTHTPSPSFWSSGFEKEDNTFTEEFASVASASSNSVLLQTSVKHSGGTALAITFAGTSKLAGVNKTMWGTPTDSWARCYVQFNSAFSFGGDFQSQPVITLIQDVADRLQLTAQCNNLAGGRDQLKWHAQLSNPTVTIYDGAFGEISKNSFHEVTIHWRSGTSADGGGEFYWNGVLKGSTLTQSLSTNYVTQLRISKTDAAASAPLGGSIMYIDDVATDIIDPGA